MLAVWILDIPVCRHFDKDKDKGDNDAFIGPKEFVLHYVTSVWLMFVWQIAVK